MSLSSHLLIAATRLRRSEITRDEYDSIAKAKIEAFADAEAAAMRERAADYLEGYAGGHHMAKSCAAAIRSLPATGEVGRE